MIAIFVKLLNMSITAGWLILAVIILRFLLKKAPRWICCFLWMLVAIRLICPFSPESVFSVIPSSETILQYTIASDELSGNFGAVPDNVFGNFGTAPDNSPQP